MANFRIARVTVAAAAALLFACGKAAAQEYDCDAGCDVKWAPVCGEDQVTYVNECVAICQDIAVDRRGVCGGGPDAKPAFMQESGKATKEVLRQFDADGFTFTGRQKLVDRTTADVEDTLKNTKQGGSKGKISASRITPDGWAYASSSKRGNLVIPPEVAEGTTGERGSAPEGRRSLRGGLPGGPGVQVGGDDARDLTVFGADSRTQVSSSTAINYPVRTIGQLNFKDGAGIGYICSGSVVSPNAVITAGHCVHGGRGKGWYNSLDFSPARYRAAAPVNPYGTWTWQYVTTFSGWTTSSSIDWDTAVINYRRNSSSQRIGDVVGWLGMAYTCPNPTTIISTHGYPGDKPYGSMWTTGICPTLTWGCGAYTASSQCDTAGGQSGSAMWRVDTRTLYGNHSSASAVANYHSMINSAKWPYIYNWAYNKPT